MSNERCPPHGFCAFLNGGVVSAAVPFTNGGVVFAVVLLVL